MALAAVENIGATFLNGQEAVSIIAIFTEMGHPQSTTPILVDSPTVKVLQMTQSSKKCQNQLI